MKTLRERVEKAARSEHGRYLLDYLDETSARTLDDLYSLIDSDAPSDTRAQACVLLGSVGDRRSSPPCLVRALLDERIRGAAMTSLERLGGANVRRRLVPLLVGHPNPEVRWAAAYALKSADDDPSAIDALIAALQDDSEDVRDHAAESLGELNPRRQRKRVRAALEAALEDSSPEVRYSATFSLSMVGNAETLSKLDRIAKLDQAPAFNETVAVEAARGAESIRMRLRL